MPFAIPTCGALVAAMSRRGLIGAAACTTLQVSPLANSTREASASHENRVENSGIGELDLWNVGPRREPGRESDGDSSAEVVVGTLGQCRRVRRSDASWMIGAPAGAFRDGGMDACEVFATELAEDAAGATTKGYRRCGTCSPDYGFWSG